MKTIYNFMLIAGSILLTACSDFLETTPAEYASSGFYRSEAAVKAGVSGIYNSLYINLGYQCPFNIYLDHYTPLATERTENSTIGAGGTLNADNSSVLSWWSGNYTIIARANCVLYGAEPYPDMLEGDAAQYLAEARVLRAYAYWNLISTFGDVPFFTAPVTIDQYDDERTDKKEVLDFILSDLETAAAGLPWIATERGRVDRAVAYGLRSRAALLGGSLDYGGEGSAYFTIAADAAAKVIGRRQLATDFDDLFNKSGQTKEDVRNEILFELMYSDQGTKKYHMVGFGQVSRNYGQTGRHPSALLADTYECIDGKRIDESPLYDPKHPGKNRDPRFKATLWMHGDTCEGNTKGTDAGRIKFVLDVYNPTTRFYNFTTGEWYSATNADINSGAAWTSFANAGVGYIWRKFSYELSEPVSMTTVNIPLMRYAEVLLNYAEAKIELNELDGPVYDAINKVRNRAGMPGVSSEREGDQDKMRQLVRRERKVELIMEGLHFVDMRRWRTGDIENDSPGYGYPVALSRDENGYIVSGGYDDATADMVPDFNTSARHDLNDIARYDAYRDRLKVRDANRYWDDKFYLFPIPQSERDRNPNLSQNEGY